MVDCGCNCFSGDVYMSDIVIFGAGKYGEVLYHYFASDSIHRVVAFTADTGKIDKTELCGLPVVPFDEVATLYPPGKYKGFVAVGYQNLNRLRAQKYLEMKAKGYQLVSYVSSKASNAGNISVGDNCCILENQSLQPCCSIGNNVTIWSGNHIGHHSVISDHCYITSHVVISGCTSIGEYCFIGVNASIGHAIAIGRECFIGAGTLITKHAADKSVFVAKDTEKYGLDSDKFIRIARM
jgi:sugar O-acyltransferase (sialic acid O-acetyltransferase NeuD family)